MTARLEDVLRTREDGAWVLLAGAAGSPGAVARLVYALEPSSLENGAHGPAGAPSEVRDTVEALAAWSPAALARVASTWIPPREVGADPWWVAAWETALRHLAGAGAMQAWDGHAAALRAEAGRVFGEVPSGAASWQRLAARARVRAVPYAVLRAEARRPLQETAITRRDLERCPRLFLRLLRSRAWLLDGAARRLVGGWLDAVPGPDALEDALVYEIATELALGGRATAVDRLSGTLTTVRDPRSVAPLVYTVLGRWVAP